MADTVMDNLDACTDCALWWANRDDSGSSRSGEEIVAAYRSTWDGWQDSRGNFPRVVIGEEVTDFASSPCDVCGDRLAGARMSAVLLDS